MLLELRYHGPLANVAFRLNLCRYLEVGQVFATKSDLLPPQYVAALKAGPFHL
jgi:hypothetical protein